MVSFSIWTCQSLLKEICLHTWLQLLESYNPVLLLYTFFTTTNLHIGHNIEPSTFFHSTSYTLYIISIYSRSQNQHPGKQDQCWGSPSLGFYHLSNRYVHFLCSEILFYFEINSFKIKKISNLTFLHITFSLFSHFITNNLNKVRFFE